MVHDPAQPSVPPADDAETVLAPARPALRRPAMWHVVMVNDDFTPMDFVVFLLVEVFGLPLRQAAAKMMEVHRAGRAVVGTFPREVAKAKADEALALAEINGHPLLLRVERAPSEGD